MKTALTIGFFDGVHLGHQSLLKRLRTHPHTTILTFSTHPQALFKPPAPPLLISLEEKLERLKPYADELLVLPFTPEFAAIPFDTLLDRFDLSHLLLGAGSVFGQGRGGTEAAVRHYASKRGITVEYLPKYEWESHPVSSSRIRQALAAGDHQLAQQLLGHL